MNVRVILASMLLCLVACKKKEAPPPAPPPPRPAPPASIRVAVANELRPAFDEIGPAFERQTGKKITFTFGAGDALEKQLVAGAPFDLLVAADSAPVDAAIQSKLCEAPSKKVFAHGVLVVWTPSDGKLAPPKSLADLTEARFHHVAVDKPEQPYGKAAAAALDSAKLSQKLKSKLLTVDDDEQAIAAVQAGKADAALVSSSTAEAHPGAQLPLTLPPSLLEQTLVVCSHSAQHNNAAQLSTFIGADGRPTLKRLGYTLPGEEAPMSH